MFPEGYKFSKFENKKQTIIDKLTDVFFITLIIGTSIFLISSVAFVIFNNK